MSKPPSANPIRRFFKRRIFTLRPGRFVFPPAPGPKKTPVKRNFFTIAIYCKHGCFSNETNTTHAIRQKSADNGCTPIATDPDKTALSNHRVSLNPAVLSFFAAALPADVFRTGLLTKNRQPKHVFNGSRRRFPFFAAVLPAGIFRTGL